MTCLGRSIARLLLEAALESGRRGRPGGGQSKVGESADKDKPADGNGERVADDTRRQEGNAQE